MNLVIKNYGYDILNFEYDRLIKELPDLRKFGYYKEKYCSISYSY